MIDKSEILEKAEELMDVLPIACDNCPFNDIGEKLGTSYCICDFLNRGLSQ